MDNEYFETLRATGEAWEAYWDAARSDSDVGPKAESERCTALWSDFQEWVVKLTTMRELRLQRSRPRKS